MDAPNMQEKSKTKSYIQTAGLLFILLVLPLGSWYYLSSGLNYQKTARAELKDYGSLPHFRVFDQEDKIFTQDSLKGNMVLASFFKPNAPQTNERFTILKALHQQFDDRKDVLFIQHVLAADKETYNLEAFAEEVDFADRGQIFYLLGTPAQTQDLLTKGYQIPQDGLPKDDADMIQLVANPPNNVSDYPYFVLMDDKGKIRNYYDSREAGQMKRLVEHMALTMPR